MSQNKKLIFDFVELVYEFESAKTADDVRNVLKSGRFKSKYENIVEHGGFEAVSWIGKLMVKIKDEETKNGFDQKHPT